MARKRKELWEVEMRCHQFSGERATFHVIAGSAAEAEAKGDVLMRKLVDEFVTVYCVGAKFLFEIDA